MPIKFFPFGIVSFVALLAATPSFAAETLTLRKEMALHPLEWKETIEILPRQHIIIFRMK